MLHLGAVLGKIDTDAGQLIEQCLQLLYTSIALATTATAQRQQPAMHVSCDREKLVWFKVPYQHINQSINK
jgi:hypothetical protein